MRVPTCSARSRSAPSRRLFAWACLSVVILLVHSAGGMADEPKLNATQQAQLDQANKAMAAADAHYQKGEYRDAVPLLIENLNIRREVLGTKHPETLSSMNNLAVLHSKLGQYAEARKLLEETLAIQRQVLSAGDSRLSASLTNLGTQLQELGELAAARKCYEEALALEERYRGDSDPQTAVAVSRMGVFLHVVGSYTQARPYLQRAYEINLKVHGEKHPSTAVALNNLGALASDSGDYTAARDYFQRARFIYIEVLGEGHPSDATAAFNLGFLLTKIRDYGSARLHFEYALKFWQARLGEKHPDVALALHCIGLTYAREQDFQRARQFVERALAMRRDLLGDQHMLVATSLCFLGEIAREEGDDAQAKKSFDEALAIERRIFGEQSLPVATIEWHLASLLLDKGQLEEAKGECERLLATHRKELGDSHPYVSGLLDLLIDIHERQGDWAKVCETLEDQRRVVRRHAAGALTGLSEKEQLMYLSVQSAGLLHAGLTWALNRPQDAEFVNRSAAWLLNGKSLALEAVAQRTLLIRDSRDPQTSETAKQLLAIREQLAARNFSKSTAGGVESEEDKTETLLQVEGFLARRLAAALGSGSQTDPWVGLDALRAAIEPHAAFVSIARFPVYRTGVKRGESRWTGERYAAWIIPPAGAGQVKIVDLGQPGEIEPLVEKARAAIGDAKALAEQGEQNAERAAREQLTALSQAVFEPIRRSLPEGTTKLMLSPDGSLWTVPWAALALPDGRYALEQYEIQYLTSGRELVQARPAAAKARPIVMANPNYDLGRRESLAATQAVLRRSANTNSPQDGTPTRHMLPKVSRLPGTAAEAKAIAPKLADLTGTEPIVYTDQYALEGVFKALARPRIVVLSTHGFVLQDQKVQPNSRGVSILPQGGNQKVADEGPPIDNPLARCGLLLAGCNATEAGAGDDGVLTGLEIVGTDLRGTELVVLSACETGLGEVQTGEGVSGLRQAFQLAGAQSVAATLWQIPDRDTALLMTDFFTELATGASKSAALRNAQLARIKAQRERNNAAHPFYWAAFTITGR